MLFQLFLVCCTAVLSSTAARPSSIPFSFCDVETGKLPPSSQMSYVVNVTAPADNSSSVVTFINGDPDADASYVSLNVLMMPEGVTFTTASATDFFVRIFRSNFNETVSPLTEVRQLYISIFRTPAGEKIADPIDFLLFTIYSNSQTCRLPLFNSVPIRTYLFDQDVGRYFTLVDADAYDTANVSIDQRGGVLNVCAFNGTATTPEKCDTTSIVFDIQQQEDIRIAVTSATNQYIGPFTVLFAPVIPPTPAPPPPTPSPPTPSTDQITGGAIFLILFFVSMTLYCFVGMVYQAVVKHERGCPQVLPNWSMWLSLFSHAYDGLRFMVGKPPAVSSSGYNVIGGTSTTTSNTLNNSGSFPQRDNNSGGVSGSGSGGSFASAPVIKPTEPVVTPGGGGQYEDADEHIA